MNLSLLDATMFADHINDVVPNSISRTLAVQSSRLPPNLCFAVVKVGRDDYTLRRLRITLLALFWLMGCVHSLHR